MQFPPGHSMARVSLCSVRVCHSPWEIVDPYPVLVNHNAGGHHPEKNLCVALVLKRGEQGV